MKAYLVDIIDTKTKVRQRIWVKSSSTVTLREMRAYVRGLEGLKVKNPRIVSFREKRLPTSIRQDLVEKAFPEFAK